MGSFVIIRPEDDAAALQASDWVNGLLNHLQTASHAASVDVDQHTPADLTNIAAAIKLPVDLVLYFGHGDVACWLTNGAATVNARDISFGHAPAVVSIACKTTAALGPAAIIAGAPAYLGFSIRVPVIAPHKNVDLIGNAIVDGLRTLANGGTMQRARDAIAANFDSLASALDTGPLSKHPAVGVAYYAAMALRDHIVLLGQSNHQPFP